MRTKSSEETIEMRLTRKKKGKMFGKIVEKGKGEWRGKVAQSNSGNRGEECLKAGE